MTNGYEDISRAVTAWWRPLQPSEYGKGDRAALARLRRAASLVEAMTEPATLDLFRALGLTSNDRDQLPLVAAIATTLAHVHEHRPNKHPMRVVGPTGQIDDSVKLKPIRFRHLLAARSAEELRIAMRRLVKLADGRFDIGILAFGMLHWTDTTRARWAFEYYSYGQDAPRPLAS